MLAAVAEAPPPHGHEPLPPSNARTVELNRSILDENDRLAERNRGFFRGKGILLLNVLSSPGSGKTTLLQRTAEALQGRLRMGVIVGDLATQNDAMRLRASGIPVVQINTGTVCHLDASMIARAAARLDLSQLDLVVIENVGNLVCPAMFDLGEELRVVLLSTTEGEDKPLKYPPMFHSAQVVVVTKMDLALATGYARDEAMTNLQHVSHHARIFELSARSGDGMDAWVEFLVSARKAILAT